MTVRVFIYYRCDGRYNAGWDDVIPGAQVTVGGTSVTTNAAGIAMFADVSAPTDVSVVMPDGVAGFELKPCRCMNPFTVCGSDFSFNGTGFLSFGFGPARRADPKCR